MAVRPDGTVITQGARGRGRLLAGCALVLAAAVICVLSLGGESAGGQAWVATGAVARDAGADISDFTLATVEVPDPRVLWPSEREPLGVAVRTINAGEPLLAGDLSAGDARSRVTLPVAPDHVPPDLQAGDVIDVWTAGSTAPLVAAAVVQAVTPPDLGAGRVEIAVDAQQVSAGVRAASSDGLVLVRLS